MKYWPVEFPTYQYNEDVVDLAKKNDLQVVDARFADSLDPELVIDKKSAPKLTKVKN